MRSRKISLRRNKNLMPGSGDRGDACGAIAVAPHVPACKSVALRGWCAASCLGAHPPFGGEALLGQEAALVIHLAGIPDPVAEVDIGEAHAPGPGDVVEDHEGAER